MQDASRTTHQQTMNATATDEHIMLVQTSASANANKFYELRLVGPTVHARWGRVGAEGQQTTYGGGMSTFNRKRREKERKGYVQVDVATAPSAGKDMRLREVAAKSLVTTDAAADPRVASLIDYLVAKNAHDIGVASGGKITVKDGSVQTPLGLLTQSAIGTARVTLAELQTATNGERIRLLERYMMTVPQSVGMSRGWQDRVLVTPQDFAEQATFLDQLEASLDVALAQSKAAAGDDDETTSDLFRFRLCPVDEAKLIDRITKKYRSTANAGHGYGVNSAKVRSVYTLTDSKRTVPFEKVSKEIGNVKELWHGSRAHNILSIMSKGLFIPPTYGSGIQIAGRMFGNGIYFSEQSTKSANYSRGGTWSSGTDNRWFMLLADVAMGNEFWPSKATGFSFGSGRYEDVYNGKITDDKGRRFNSVNVKAGTAGVRNHEAIVANLDQINLRYLVEFEG